MILESDMIFGRNLYGLRGGWYLLGDFGYFFRKRYNKYIIDIYEIV